VNGDEASGRTVRSGDHAETGGAHRSGQPGPPHPGGDRASRTRWGLAFRLARREVRRHPWRHALVTVMILVPVLAAMAAFTATRFWEDTSATQSGYRRWAGSSPSNELYEGDPVDPAAHRRPAGQVVAVAGGPWWPAPGGRPTGW
jgi:hypothetical protein